MRDWRFLLDLVHFRCQAPSAPSAYQNILMSDASLSSAMVFL